MAERGFENQQKNWKRYKKAGNTKGGSITVPLTSCLTGLESVKQKVSGTVILPPLVFPEKRYKKASPLLPILPEGPQKKIL
jgi:hypothetical protein